MTAPVDYSMCCQSVTVYRKTPEGIARQVIDGCYLQWQDGVTYETLGKRKERSFLLVQPGAEQLVFAGDRILEGVGPEVSEEQWKTFVPALVPGLGEAAYARAYCWQGLFCHTEAGRK